MARPTKLTLKLQRLLCRLVQSGCGHDDAARLAKIDPDTFRRWMNAGKKKTNKSFAGFYAAIRLAESKRVVPMIQICMKVAEGGYVVEERTIKKRGGGYEKYKKIAPPNGQMALKLAGVWRPEFSEKNHELAELRKQIRELERLLLNASRGNQKT